MTHIKFKANLSYIARSHLRQTNTITAKKGSNYILSTKNPLFGYNKAYAWKEMNEEGYPILTLIGKHKKVCGALWDDMRTLNGHLLNSSAPEYVR